MLTFAEAVEIVAKVQYKPGWRFHVSSYQSYPAPICYLQIIFTAPDVRTGIPGNIAGIVWPFHAELYDEKQLLGLALQAVLHCEDHEAREFFRYDGKQIYDPHAEPKAA